MQEEDLLTRATRVLTPYGFQVKTLLDYKPDVIYVKHILMGEFESAKQLVEKRDLWEVATGIEDILIEHGIIVAAEQFYARKMGAGSWMPSDPVDTGGDMRWSVVVVVREVGQEELERIRNSTIDWALTLSFADKDEWNDLG